ncbi:M56 family metallopeptidase [Agathobaculum sp. NTUH-O15-33]|uniref:M56 family metallopeptidase n=1 Tax=Agathobaculum sp. NTUH-O15-33 TaxID=3079302 RepID=UPI00295856C3|nr:M56 family metallopeptidase [Agathobaculum sp. NTUH-O15-33]WNX84963.1 M56 family metallopeptidase [Agathobaculum sp. NTUH-O15-33]
MAMRFSAILIWSLTATVTAGLLFAVKWLFREHLTAKWHYLVWMILLARLVIPPTGGFLPKNDFSLGAAVDVPSIAGAVTRQAAALSSGETPPTPVVRQSEGRFIRLHLPQPGLPDWADTLNRGLFWLWAAGAAGLLAYYFTASLLLGVRTRRFPKANEALQARAEQMYRLAAQMEPEEEAYRVRVRLSPAGATPYVCGVFWPTLVVPAPMAETVADEVLLHEMVHMVRHDIVKNYLYMVFRCLHWFNPLLWRTFNRISDDCETACDECVLDRLEPEEHIGYGRRLLEMVQPGFRYRMGTSCIASGERNIRRRIVRVTRHKEVSRRARGMSFLLFCLLAWMCLTPPLARAASWRDPGVPGADTAKWLQKAERYRVSDINEAFYLYGKGYALDNGYYRYIVADDETREALARTFSENEKQGKLPWAFDDQIVDWLYDANYGQVQADPVQSLDYPNWSINPAFALYNVTETSEGGAATILYPMCKLREDELNQYRYDRVRAYRQGGQYIVQSVEAGKVAARKPWWEYPLEDRIFTYRAEDAYFDYEARIASSQSYMFYSYKKATGEWLEQADPMMAMMGWGGETNLPIYDDTGISGQLFIRPKAGVSMAGVLGIVGAPAPMEQDMVPETNPERSSATGSEFGKFIGWAQAAALSDLTPDTSGWYATSLLDNNVFRNANVPDKIYLRTQLNGGEIMDVILRAQAADMEETDDGTNG